MIDWLRHLFGAIVEGIGKGLGDIGDKLVWESFFNRHVPETPSRNGWGVSAGADEKPEKGSLDQFLDLHSNHGVDHDRAARDVDRAPGIDL